jgi:hypothetical protein
LDLESGEETREFPTCITPSEFRFIHSSAVLVSCVGDDGLVELRLDSGELSPLIDIDPSAPQKPYALAFDPRKERIGVTYQLTHKVAFSSLATLASPNLVVEVDGVPQSLTWLSSDRAVVTIRSPDGAQLIDTESGTILARADYTGDCERPSEFALGPHGELYVVCQGDGFERGQLARVNTEDLALERLLPLGVGPDRLAVSVPW